MDDNEIVDLFFERSENAINELSAKYGNACLGLSRRITGSMQDAEECVNDAYLGVWNAIPPARPQPLVAFVLRIVRNISVNRLEHNIAKKRQGDYQQCVKELERMTGSHDTPESEYEKALLSGYIDEFLNSLDKVNRYIFVRRYWYIDTYEDISKSVSIRAGAVRTRLSRTRKQLKAFLKGKGVEL